jgi:hypothetical protein
MYRVYLEETRKSDAEDGLPFQPPASELDILVEKRLSCRIGKRHTCRVC